MHKYVIWNKNYCRRKATQFRPTLSIDGLQAGRDLNGVITAVTRDLGLHSSIQSKHSVMSYLTTRQRNKYRLFNGSPKFSINHVFFVNGLMIHNKQKRLWCAKWVISKISRNEPNGLLVYMCRLDACCL